jgi:hypothetical protein
MVLALLFAGCAPPEPSAFAEAATSFAWNAARADAFAEDAVDWDWPEAGPWGWQGYGEKDADGHQTGSWVFFPPKDFVTLALGDELVRVCEDEFAAGAATCNVSAFGVEFALSADGHYDARVDSVDFAKAFRAAATVRSSRLHGGTVEGWREPGAAQP